MALSKQYRTPPSYPFKSLFLGGVFVASSVAVIGFSQPGMALVAPPENCGPVGRDAKAHGHYSRATLAASAAGFGHEDGLFWNPLAKSWLTAEQVELLQLAYEVGFKDGGHQHAELLQAILLQETLAGQLGRMGHMTAPVGKRSYGVMQVKVTAARDVINGFSEFGQFHADEELIARLLSDDEFNIRIASKFLLQLSSRARTADRSLVAYNVGLSASHSIPDPEGFKYVLGARSNLEEVVRPFNQRFGDAALRLASAVPDASGSSAARPAPG